jgi:predicted ATP-binding protein involved in virulence
MKIRKIKWTNHPVLGNLEINLVNGTNGLAYDTVVFAGENGTGKTSILETISSFLNSGPFEHFEYIEYSVDGNIFKAIPTSDGTNHKPFYDVVDGAGTVHKIRADKNNTPELIVSNTKDMRHSGFVFSKARADYKTRQITSTVSS